MLFLYFTLRNFENVIFSKFLKVLLHPYFFDYITQY